MTLFRERRPSTAGDDGFTLMEVVVAIALITMVMTAVLTFFVKGVASGADRERRADAVDVATQQIEVVRSVPVGALPSTVSATLGSVPSGTAGLVIGRSQSDVSAQWATTATATKPGAPAELSTMNQAYQAATVSGTLSLPFARTQQVGNQKFDVSTYVGFCYVTTTGCTKAAAIGSVPMYKVVVQVSWNQGKGNVSQYVTSTLIDASADQVYAGS